MVVVPDSLNKGPIPRIHRFVSEFFSKGSERTLQVKKNIVLSLAFKSISIIVNIILVPLTINYINPVQYGIWITMSSILAWFSFFDIGMGNGLRNKFAESKSLGNDENVRIYVSTTYAALAIIFSLLWIIFLISNYFIDWSIILNAPRNLSAELSRVVLLFFSFICIQVVLKLINTVLTADQKPAKAAFLDMMGQMIILITIFILTKKSNGSLTNLVMAFGLIPILIFILSSIWFYSHPYKKYSPSLKHVRFKHAKDIMKLGAKFFVIQISVIVIYQTTNIIIAHVSGPESVSVYNVSYKYFNIVYFLFSIINFPFWSAFTDAHAQNDFDWMKRSVRKLELLALGAVVIFIFLLAVSPVVYKLWIGDIIHIDFSISLLVMLYFITSVYTSLYTQILNGIGKINLQLYVVILGAFLVIPIAILLGKKYGIEGVIAATVLINILSLIYAPLQVHLVLRRKATGIFDK